MIVLNIAVLTAAAASIGIFDRDALVVHLGRDVTRPASLELIALILDRLPVTLGMVADVVESTAVECSTGCAVRASLCS